MGLPVEIRGSAPLTIFLKRDLREAVRYAIGGFERCHSDTKVPG